MSDLMQFTYNSLKRESNREIMLNEAASSLGNLVGNNGMFQEQARVLTLSGATLIKQEIDAATGSIADIIDTCPTLKELLK